MRRVVLFAISASAVGATLAAGTALASANDRDDVRERSSGAAVAAGPPFDLEVDPELDARFGPRPVNAVQAAAIATARFGGRVVEAELDEEDGRPLWELKLSGATVGDVDVDAINGAILGDDDDGGDDDGDDDD
jgi:uncharacterized membrane protein YkoI